MPLYKNKNDQNEKEFINSCMSDSTMIKEFKNNDQRLAVCYKQFEISKKSKNKANWKSQSNEDYILIN
jgi:hypothetical protein